MKRSAELNTESPSKKKKRSLSKLKKTKEKKRGPANFQESNSTEDNSINESNENFTTEEIASNFNVEVWSSLGVPPLIIKALQDQNFESPTEIQTLTLPPAILGRRDILGAAETGSGKTLAFGIPIINGILELKKRERKIISSNSGKFQESNLGCTDEIEVEEIEKKEIEHKETPKGIKEFKRGKEIENFEDEDLEVEDEEMGMGCVHVIENVKMNDEFKDSRKPLYALILTPTRELAIQIKNHLTKAAKYTDIRIAVILGGMAAVKQERILSKGPEIVIATPGRLWELVQDGNPHLSQLDSIK